ncbi:hypothetical protein BO71DRAFT_399136 [Aspergillus ellipticus CBS 707.79]|uniref:Uncharacterized protein n=1 Tax=Aspergillus ellipticus CBS 707.79 TaxID=1448320 RepID=A0A319D9K2_9EURO|nr:hypothetical protein BO71DRAFT_399136 [Aspergillus ellipticus CBS 707.79]
MADSAQHVAPRRPSSPRGPLASDNESGHAHAPLSSDTSSAGSSSFYSAQSYIFEDDSEARAAEQACLQALAEHLSIRTPTPPEVSRWSSDSSDYNESPAAPAPVRMARPARFMSMAEPEPERKFPIATTTFVGNPRPRVGHPTQLSCVVFVSSWPEGYLPENCHTRTQKSIMCNAVIRFHEECLIQVAEWSCVACSEPTPAEAFVHRPILFTRTGLDGLEDGPRRGLIMRFGQLTRSRWNYPDMNATLGGAAEGQAFEVAVPICGKNACDETARLMANELINSIIPSVPRLRMKMLDIEIAVPTQRVGAIEGTWEPESADVLVLKLAPDCVPLEAEEVAETDQDDDAAEQADEGEETEGEASAAAAPEA